MTRVPDDLARDLVEWAADDFVAEFIDERGMSWCLLCEEPWDSGHTDDCLHTRSAEWLAAEAMTRPDRAPDEAGPGMRAKVVS